MIKKSIAVLWLFAILGGMMSFKVSASDWRGFNSLGSASASLVNFEKVFALTQPNLMSVKKGEPYDASKDPALRRGTENWEEPQGSFFAVPALVLGVIAVLLFFNKKQD